MTGSFTYITATGAAAAGSYDCYQEFDIVGTSASDCSGCSFSFEATWTLDSTTAVGSDCLDSSLTWGLGFAADPSNYSNPVFYYDSGSGWYGISYGTFAGGEATGSYGLLDYPYTSGGSTYYYSQYVGFELAPY